MKIAIFAAGTGGHIYPALSIAEKFGKENVIFIASNRAVERKIYKNSGFQVSHLNISGFRGKNLFEKAYERLKSEFEAVLKTTPEEVQKKMDKALGRAAIVETAE